MHDPNVIETCFFGLLKKKKKIKYVFFRVINVLYKKEIGIFRMSFLWR